MGKPELKDATDGKDSFVDELKPGTKLMHGQYTIENFLNAGGFGITYLAKDSLDRKIVIKECFPGAFCRRSRYVVQARSRAHQNELKSIVRLFVQEARSLAKLDHPNIVGVHQVFEDNETAYMALDFVEGRDLLDTIEDPNHGLLPSQIKPILKEVLSAVGFIHDQGILHRDISPDNILINEDLHPVLIDFGAAREEATKQSRVLSALRVVKDGYSPQEFYIAGSDQSPSSDLYALAASFHHLIANEVPPNSQARLAAIASGEPDPFVPLLGRIEGYDENFLAALDKALAVLPKDRLQSAQAWLDMMEGVEGNVTSLNVAGAAAAAVVDADDDDEEGKSKMPLLLGSAAVIALLAGAGLYVMNSGNSADPAPEVTATTLETPAAPEQSEVAANTTVEDQPVTTGEAAALETDETTPVAPTDIASATAPDTAATIPPVPVPTVETPEVAVPSAEATAPEVIAPEVPESPVQDSAQAADPDSATSALDGPQIVSGPEIVDETVPVLRPTNRPADLEVAALPEAVEPAPMPVPVDTPVPTVAEPTEELDLPGQPQGGPVADAATQEILLPNASSIIEGVGTGPVAEEIPAIAPGNEILPPAVGTNWSVVLPFEPANTGSNVVGDIAVVSPIWVREGLEITSVNGTDISAISEIPAVLRDTTDASEVTQTPVTFGVRDPSTGATDTHDWAVPVLQETELLNGMRFRSTFAGAEWRTVVVDVPASEAGDLQAGDVIKSYITTGEAITDRNGLANLLEREIEKGVNQFTFSVERDNSMWVAQMSYDTEQN